MPNRIYTKPVYAIDPDGERINLPVFRGNDGPQGEPGSDAEVTQQNIETALGYAPADRAAMMDLRADVQVIDGYSSAVGNRVKHLESAMPSRWTAPGATTPFYPTMWIDHRSIPSAGVNYISYYTINDNRQVVRESFDASGSMTRYDISTLMAAGTSYKRLSIKFHYNHIENAYPLIIVDIDEKPLYWIQPPGMSLDYNQSIVLPERSYKIYLSGLDNSGLQYSYLFDAGDLIKAASVEQANWIQNKLLNETVFIDPSEEQTTISVLTSDDGNRIDGEIAALRAEVASLRALIENR